MATPKQATPQWRDIGRDNMKTKSVLWLDDPAREAATVEKMRGRLQ